MASRRPPRLKGFSYIGFHRYSLTFCTAGRARHFVRHEYVAAALTEFQRTLTVEHFALNAYCFMPDHVHLVIEGESVHADLRRA